MRSGSDRVFEIDRGVVALTFEGMFVCNDPGSDSAFGFPVTESALRRGQIPFLTQYTSSYIFCTINREEFWYYFINLMMVVSELLRINEKTFINISKICCIISDSVLYFLHKTKIKTNLVS